MLLNSGSSEQCSQHGGWAHGADFSDGGGIFFYLKGKVLSPEAHKNHKLPSDISNLCYIHIRGNVASTAHARAFSNMGKLANYIMSMTGGMQHY